MKKSIISICSALVLSLSLFACGGKSAQDMRGLWTIDRSDQASAAMAGDSQTDVLDSIVFKITNDDKIKIMTFASDDPENEEGAQEIGKVVNQGGKIYWDATDLAKKEEDKAEYKAEMVWEGDKIRVQASKGSQSMLLVRLNKDGYKERRAKIMARVAIGKALEGKKFGGDKTEPNENPIENPNENKEAEKIKKIDTSLTTVLSYSNYSGTLSIKTEGEKFYSDQNLVNKTLTLSKSVIRNSGSKVYGTLATNNRELLEISGTMNQSESEINKISINFLYAFINRDCAGDFDGVLKMEDGKISGILTRQTEQCGLVTININLKAEKQ